jgi:S1-C subfamily serine protease
VIVWRDAHGYCALTNRHVVECGLPRRSLPAATPGTASAPARVCWSAPRDVDLAVVRVANDGSGPIEAVQVRSDLPHVGDPVFAVGNPMGYEASYTAGVISAVRTTAENEGIAEMIAFQSYNVKSPLNGAAARWAENRGPCGGVT